MTILKCFMDDLPAFLERQVRAEIRSGLQFFGGKDVRGRLVDAMKELVQQEPDQYSNAGEEKTRLMNFFMASRKKRGAVR